MKPYAHVPVNKIKLTVITKKQSIITVTVITGLV